MRESCGVLKKHLLKTGHVVSNKYFLRISKNRNWKTGYKYFLCSNTVSQRKRKVFLSIFLKKYLENTSCVSKLCLEKDVTCIFLCFSRYLCEIFIRCFFDISLYFCQEICISKIYSISQDELIKISILGNFNKIFLRNN